MDAGSVQQRLDSGLEREAWEYKNEYESVSVLVLYWQESDNPGFEKEGHDVGNFFDQRCCYTVEYFPIPSKDSYMWLDDKLNDFWKNYGGKNRLIIIHYGGHGDEDISGGKKAVWAACSQGGPTVKWSKIQAKIENFEAHVLLLLDCCFAGQAGRSRVIFDNLQLLAACGMGVKSPLPGPKSFTTNLIRHIEKSLDSKGFADISDISNVLVEKGSGYEKMPVHLKGSRISVRLQAFDKSPTEQLVNKQGAAYLNIRISLHNKLTGSSLEDCIKWLREFPFWKESLMTTGYADGSDTSSSSRIDDGRLLQNEAKQQPITGENHDISTARKNFNVMLDTLAAQLRDPSSDQPSQNLVLYFLSTLETALSWLRQAVIRSTMASPKLAEVIEEARMKDLEIPGLIRKRLSIPPPSRSELSEGIDHSSRADRPQSTSLIDEDFKSKRKVVVSDTNDNQSSLVFSGTPAVGTGATSKTKHKKNHSSKAESLNDMISSERRLSRSPSKTSQPTGSQDNLYISENYSLSKADVTKHLLDCVEKGDVERTIHFIKMGAEVNHVVDHTCLTPLLIAAECRHTQICFQLLEKGANINAKDKSSRNVLHLALSNYGKEDVVSCLLDYDPDLNAQDECGKTPLHYCVELDKRDAAQSLLLKGAMTEITSRTGETPLSFAIRMRRTKLVELLLSRGAEIRDTDEENASPDIKHIITKHRKSRGETQPSAEQSIKSTARSGHSSTWKKWSRKKR